MTTPTTEWTGAPRGSTMAGMLALGQTIERYTVEAVVGQGGMAVVYRVRHNQLGSLHALKILTVPRERIRERLLQEGRLQAGLRHPNVVQVTDVLEIDGSPALLMEYVDGPTLAQWLEAYQPALEDTYALFRGICEGVGEAHHHGLVHRDLKPANVLLARTRTGFLPKVTDFGIAKHRMANEHVATGSNASMGTPAYMAPEQIRDAKSVDLRADIFSLGCILYELLCGQRPFGGSDVLSIFNAIVDGGYIHPLDLNPDLPDELVAAVEGCLVVDRDQRFQDCHALLSAIGGGHVPVGPIMRVRTGWEPRAPSSPTLMPASGSTDLSRQDTVERIRLGPLRSPPRSLDSVDTLSFPIDPNADTVPTAPGRRAFPPTPRPAPAAQAPPRTGPSMASWIAAAVVGALVGVALLAAALAIVKAMDVDPAVDAAPATEAP